MHARTRRPTRNPRVALESDATTFEAGRLAIRQMRRGQDSALFEPRCPMASWPKCL